MFRSQIRCFRVLFHLLFEAESTAANTSGLLLLASGETPEADRSFHNETAMINDHPAIQETIHDFAAHALGDVER